LDREAAGFRDGLADGVRVAEGEVTGGHLRLQLLFAHEGEEFINREAHSPDERTNDPRLQLAVSRDGEVPGYVRVAINEVVPS
jgi:hypothetical protein